MTAFWNIVPNLFMKDLRLCLFIFIKRLYKDFHVNGGSHRKENKQKFQDFLERFSSSKLHQK